MGLETGIRPQENDERYDKRAHGKVKSEDLRVKSSIAAEKSYGFAIRTINLYKYLIERKDERILSRQLLRRGKSIGDNIEKALGAQSIKDFFAKLSISYKEARETHYRIRLLRNTGYLQSDEVDSILQDCKELFKIIGSIKKS